MTGRLRVPLLLLAGLGLLAWRPFSVSAQGLQLGETQNAVGTLIVVRPDGVEERLKGKRGLQLFEADVLRTDASSHALIELRDGTQVALSENTTLKLLWRWEKAKGVTPIVQLAQGEIWVRTGQGTKPLEVQTPVAVAAVRETEFDLKVLEDGQSTLTVIQGTVEFATPSGTCSIRPSTVSHTSRGRSCTPPTPADGKPVIAWTQALVK
jgi:hypothetical protein